MNLKVIFTILFKELKETLRDKRTLIAMIGVPVVLYPLLFIVTTQVILYQQDNIQKRQSKVALRTGTPEIISSWINEIGIPKSTDNTESSDDSKDSSGTIEIVECLDPNTALKNGDIHAIISASASIDTILINNGGGQILIEYDATELDSKEAKDRISKMIRERSTNILSERLKQADLTEDFAKPLVCKLSNTASAQKTSGDIMGKILPMLMIIMLGVGAFYPAVDLTAGEKERGTFETLLSTPTSKLEIVSGKLLHNSI